MRSVDHNPRQKMRVRTYADERTPARAASPAAAQAADLRDTIVVDLSRVRLFGLRFACPAAPEHAFVEAAGHVLRGDHAKAEERLATYYQRWCPRSAAEVLGLPDSHELADWPAAAAVVPWYPEGPGHHLENVEARARAYYSHSGLSGWGVSDGLGAFGPASRRKVRHVVSLLAGAVAATRDHDPTGTAFVARGAVLEDDSSLRARPYAVNLFDEAHAVAALAAHGRRTARVETPGRRVRRSESAGWAQVQSGVFTEAEALRVFDDLLRGRPE